MNENLVTKLIADLDKITSKIEEIQAMCKVEKKEPRKLAEIMDKGHCWSFPELASVAIDAVIECYFEWYNNTTKPLGKFPEYLKEKML